MGIQDLEHQHAAAIDEYVARQRFLQKTLLAIAGCFAAVAAIAADLAAESGGRRLVTVELNLINYFPA